MFVVRTGPSVILELIMTIALFYIMHLLIAVTYVLVPPAIDFVNVKEAPAAQTQQKKPQTPSIQESPPPKPPSQEPMFRTDPLGYGTTAPANDAGLKTSSTGITDSEYLSVFQVLPLHSIRGLGGRVFLNITVTTTGRVIEPVVVQNCTWDKPAHDDELCASHLDRFF